MNEKTNQKLLSDAIASANSHADQQFGTVRANVENLGKEVEGVGKALDEKTAAINAALSAATGSINTNLGKVGKPVPIPPPRIEFTLADVPGSAIPVREEVIKPNADGTFSFKFNVINMSDITAEESEMWITICTLCEYVGTPTGFDHPPGENERMRHMVLGNMHAGVAHGENAVSFKSSSSVQLPWYGVTFAFACKTCGKPKNEPDYKLNIDYSGIQPKRP